MTKTYTLTLTQDELDKALTTSQVPVYAKPVNTKYRSFVDMPATVLALPKSAQELFKEVYDSWLEKAPNDEAEVFKQAWRAVKSKFEKRGDGWSLKKEMDAELVATIGGPYLSDLDHLKRQLIIDGYEEVAQYITSDVETSVTALRALPAGYSDVMVDRYYSCRKSGNESFNVEVAFKAILPEKKITYGVVYPPNEIDLQKEWANEEIIEDAAHNFLANHRMQDKYHNEQAGAGTPVESYIAPCDIYEFHGKKLSEPIRKGSWIMATKWTDDSWNEVKSGKINGYSIGGMKKVRR